MYEALANDPAIYRSSNGYSVGRRIDNLSRADWLLQSRDSPVRMRARSMRERAGMQIFPFARSGSRTVVRPLLSAAAAPGPTIGAYREIPDEKPVRRTIICPTNERARDLSHQRTGETPSSTTTLALYLSSFSD